MTLLALTLTCTLLSVTDGDTLRAACPEPTRIRIANIDAPETDTCPGPAALAAVTAERDKVRRFLKISRKEGEDALVALAADLAATRAALAEAQGALRKIKDLRPRVIDETGFQTGPASMLNEAQAIARQALKGTTP